MISPPPRSPLFPYTTLFRSWWRAGQEAAGRILRDDAGSDLQLQLYRYDAADLVADAAIEHQEPDPGNTLDYPDRHRLLRRDLPLQPQPIQWLPANPRLRSVATDAGRLLAANPRPVASDRFLLWRPGSEHPSERAGSFRSDSPGSLRCPSQSSRQQRDAICGACRFRASIERGVLGIRPCRPRVPHTHGR